MNLSRRIATIILLAVSQMTPSFAHADSRASANFVIAADTINSGTADMASANFRLGSSLGDSFGAATQGSIGFLLKPGFRNQLNFAVPSMLNLISVFSRKVHGAAGPHDIPVDIAAALNGEVTVEPRLIGTGHTIHFRFAEAITNGGTVAVTDAGGAPIGSAVAAASGNDVIITLTGIADNRRARISLSNPNGSAFAASVAMGFLVGDVNNSRSVNATDIAGIKARSTAGVTSANFKLDVNLSGVISSSDVSAAKARAGLTLP